MIAFGMVLKDLPTKFLLPSTALVQFPSAIVPIILIFSVKINVLMVYSILAVDFWLPQRQRSCCLNGSNKRARYNNMIHNLVVLVYLSAASIRVNSTIVRLFLIIISR
ncbi:uncharacterized protein EV154DRAFT_493023 [Mucor mucedo]|uniref:uncharacterized protein n=1 Tax=Mucor mucedo TaxID=29922 RepID=UPI00221FB919|nr:uncharacterized protein EV154DRAFT_493023 [Mucor mucedo]KAI7896324.1 hypothetical protein EV154DRAFT_493023 [Mucor mucedo]